MVFLLSNKLLLRFSEYITSLNEDFAAPDVLFGAIRSEENRQKNLVLTVIDICKIFSDSGIEYVLVKTIDGYPDVGKDVDVVILSKYKKAVFELQKNGFRRVHLPVIRKNCNKFYKQKNGLVITVDLYDGCLTLIGETITVNSFQNSDNICHREFCGVSVPVPCPEVSFLIKLDELYLNGELTLGYLCNLSTLSSNPDFDWQYVTGVVEKAGTSPGLFYVLSLLNQNVTLTNQNSDLLTFLKINKLTKRILTHFSKPPTFPTKTPPAVTTQMWINKFLREGANANFFNSFSSLMLLFYLLGKQLFSGKRLLLGC